MAVLLMAVTSHPSSTSHLPPGENCDEDQLVESVQLLGQSTGHRIVGTLRGWLTNFHRLVSPPVERLLIRGYASDESLRCAPNDHPAWEASE